MHGGYVRESMGSRIVISRDMPEPDLDTLLMFLASDLFIELGKKINVCWLYVAAGAYVVSLRTN